MGLAPTLQFLLPSGLRMKANLNHCPKRGAASFACRFVRIFRDGHRTSSMSRSLLCTHIASANFACSSEDVNVSPPSPANALTLLSRSRFKLASLVHDHNVRHAASQPHLVEHFHDVLWHHCWHQAGHVVNHSSTHG